MKYAWIKEHRDDYSVVQLCRAMRVNKSGFYPVSYTHLTLPTIYSV